MKILHSGMTPFELHMHTAETSPCARSSAAEMVHMCADAGYGGVFITDHFSPYALAHIGSPTKDYFHITLSWEALVARFLRGYELAKRVGEAMGLKVFLGAEITLESGPEDYLVPGIKEEFLYSHPALLKYSPAQLKAAVNAAGLYLIQAHPGRENMTLQPAQLLDGMEVYNGNFAHNNRNDEMLAEAKRRGCIMTSGSDAHSPRCIGRGGMWLPDEINDGTTMARYIAQNSLVIQRIETPSE